MKKEVKDCGHIVLGRKVYVTDPGYDEGAWGRAAISNLVPGHYLCQVEFKTKAGGCKAVSKARVILDDCSPLARETQKKVLQNRSWRFINYIGVDSGLAGFFADKPDFNDTEWSALCDWMYPTIEDGTKDCSRQVFIKRFDNGTDGFWTNSGYGDGSYEVYAIRDRYNNKPSVVALEIRFF